MLFFANFQHIYLGFRLKHLALFQLWTALGGSGWKVFRMVEFLKAPFLVLHFSYYTSMAFLMMLSVILLSMLILSTLSVIRHLICGINLFATELESDLRDTVDWGRKWLDFSAGKTQLVSFDWSSNNGVIDMKIDVSVLEENHLWRCWGWLSLLNWIGALTLFVLLKLPPWNLKSWFVLWSFLLLKLLCISVNYHKTMNWILMSCLRWCSYLLLGIVIRSATKMDM